MNTTSFANNVISLAFQFFGVIRTVSLLAGFILVIQTRRPADVVMPPATEIASSKLIGVLLGFPSLIGKRGYVPGCAPSPVIDTFNSFTPFESCDCDGNASKSVRFRQNPGFAKAK
jgi:hypothetical protein